MHNSYPYDDDDEYTYNNFSGESDHVIQAGSINGDINTNYYDREYGTFEYRIFPYAGVIYFVTLAIISSTYSHLFRTADLDFWDWPKLTVSTLVLIGAFVTTHEWIFDNPSFLFLRVVAAIVTIIIGYNYASSMQPIDNLNALISGWLIWKF